MPTVSGVPISALPGGPLNPVDWLDTASPNGVGGVQQGAIMRGTGGALAYWQKRQIAGPQTIAQGAPVYLQSRPYDRGAGAFSPKFGHIPINPIGAGVYAPFRIPTIAGPGARYEMAAIWFDVQSIPTTINFSPTMPAESVNALLSMSYVAAMYPTTG